MYRCLTVFYSCQPPVLSQTRDLINIPAIVEPHQGTSYNPPVDAHKELLLKAAAVEEKRLKGVEKLAAVKAKMDSALRETDGLDDLGAAGMTVLSQIDSENAREEEREEGEEGDGHIMSSLPRNLANRKTKTQKNKAARVLAEVCLVFPPFSHYSSMSGFL
jgi:nucleolar protein 53